MHFEQRDQALSSNGHGRQFEEPTPEPDDFSELRRKGLNLRPLWRILQRNALLITGVTTMVTAAALYPILTSPPTYKGNFQLLAEPLTPEARYTDPSILSRDEESRRDVISRESDGFDYQTLLQVLQSPGVLSTIASQIQTRYPDVSYDSLSRDLVIQRVPPKSSGGDAATTQVASAVSEDDLTKLIEVNYQADDPEKTLFVLQEISKGYLKFSLENRKARISEGIQFIEAQRPKLQQQANEVEGKLEKLQQRYKISDPETEGAELAKEAREVKADQLEAQRELREQKALYTSLRKQLDLTSKQAIAASTLTQEPRYQQLLTELKRTEGQIAVESARFSAASPQIQALQERQKNLSAQLAQETRRILGPGVLGSVKNPKELRFQSSTRLNLTEQLADSANQIKALEARNQETKQAKASLDKQLGQYPAVIRQYGSLQRELTLTANVLNQLLSQRETLRVEAAQKNVPWKIISAPRLLLDATGSSVLFSRDTIKKLAAGVVAGFLLGLGAALILEKQQNVFYTVEDIQDLFKLPLLGMIPFSRRTKHDADALPTNGSVEATESNTLDAYMFQEAFGSLYVSLHFISSDASVRSLVVGSAAPGDGKSTVALHLAQAAASVNRRVLLVDANLRSPQLHTRLGLPNHKGLSDLLAHNLNPHELIQRSRLEDNLVVLTSGQPQPNSPKLLASAQMQHLIAEFQAAFDLVIYDTPHLLGLADAKFLAEHTNGILMVVGVGRTDRSIATQAMNELNTYRLPILGVVANCVEQRTTNLNGYHSPHQQNHPERPTAEINHKYSNQY